MTRTRKPAKAGAKTARSRKPRAETTKTVAPVSRRWSAPPTDLAAMEEQTPRLITLTEAAFRLGRVHRTTVMRWVKEGKVHCVRLSRKAILFEPAEIDRFIRDHRYSG
jgi:excisionase family DNA binding protein